MLRCAASHGVSALQEWTNRLVARVFGLPLTIRRVGRRGQVDVAIAEDDCTSVRRISPSLFRQTTRHEVAVATVSARYLAQGFTWRRDRQPSGRLEHQADGVATRGGIVELVEVELTPKSWRGCQKIVTNHAYCLVHEDVDRVAYFCTADAYRAITREADKQLVRSERPRVVSCPCLDARGLWIGPNLGAGDHAVQLEAARQLDGPEAWARFVRARA